MPSAGLLLNNLSVIWGLELMFDSFNVLERVLQSTPFNAAIDRVSRLQLLL